MANLVFWILFWLLIATLLITNALHERSRREAVRKKISDSFGKSDEECFPTDRFDKRPALFDHLVNDASKPFYIDDITVNDLGLRDIFARMNSCRTCAGTDMLYSSLRLKTDCSYEFIKPFTVDKEKATELAFILEQAKLKCHDEDGFDLLRKLSDAKADGLAVDIAMPVLITASLGLCAVSPVTGIVAVIIMVFVSISLYFTGKKNMDDNLKGFALASRMIACSEKLYTKGCDGFGKYNGLKAIRRGNSLISYRDQTTSDPLSVLLDYVRMITHVDLIIYKLKISGIREHTKELQGLYMETGKLDACIALASYLYGKKHCAADISDDHVISGKNIYHPLIKDPVCNDITAKRGILITGSNASGKSTFLKAVGINVLCSENLGFAFADSFNTYDFRIYTSMALSDNILGGESYYVVEAKSIKRICDAASSGGCLCIIDEVLRGTNTVERIAASSKILGSLCRPSVICIAATHDLELTGLLSSDMDMYYFTEEIEGDDISFTFRINRGVSDRTNAIRLLDMLGFDSDVVSSATGLVDDYRKTHRWGIDR